MWFGNNAEKIISSKGMTKKAVSEKSGIPYSTLNFILNGQRSVTLDDVASLAEATGSSPSDFMPPQFRIMGNHTSALTDGGVA